MLSDTDVRELVRQGAIELSYAFLPDGSGQFVRQPRPLKPRNDQAAQDFFEDRLIRSRVALTLGPLVKPVSHARHVARNRRFTGHRRIVDLRNCVDGWALLPGQSVVVCTNEYFKLTHDIVGLIIGRVSSYNNGLVTATSYLDSGWDGIVKLLLINTSQKPARLNLGMEVGRIFFIRTPRASTDTSIVGRQGVHYGLNWPRVLDDQIDPFLPPPPTPPRARLRMSAAAFNDVLQRYAGVGLLAVAVAGTFGAARVYTELTAALAQAQTVRQLAERVTFAESRMPVNGSSRITILRGEKEAEIVVNLPKGVLYRGVKSVGLASLREGPAETVVTVTTEQNDQGEVVLRLGVKTVTAARTDTQLSITWSYLP